MSDRPARRQQHIPISLGKPSLRLRLEAYYSLVAPDTIADETLWRSRFDQIYDKFGGSHEKERRLANKLAKKYGTTVKLLLAESAVDVKRRALQPDTAVKREEEWYLAREIERDSGVIDFTSDKFDPVAALAAPETALSSSNPWLMQTGPMHDHIDQCRTLLPECDPMRRIPVVTRKRGRDGETLAADNEKRPKKLSPFASLAANHDERGPLSLLHAAIVKRQRVRVMIRYNNGIRGTLTGYLLAFDKHFNVLLRDVDEVYSPRLVLSAEVSNVERELTRRQSAVTSNHEKNRKRGEWCVRQRHMKQMLVRGDNVVMVYKAQSERSVWPRTSKSPSQSVYQKVPTNRIPPEKRVGTPGSLIYAPHHSQRTGR